MSGTGDGTWATSLPTQPLVQSLNVTSITSGNVLNSLVLHGLTHTWIGDLHIVLEDPTTTKHTVQHRTGFTGAGFGCGDDVSLGDYTFVDQLATDVCNGIGPIGCSGSLVPGTYTQDSGNWTPTLGIDNASLESLPAITGTWKLYIYDWAGGDSGSLTSWDLCFGPPTTPPPPPTNSSTCVGTGPGGAYGVGVDGTWPTTMPTGQLSSVLAVSVPSGSTKIVGVKINGWAHTWYDDTQIVLEAPNGLLYNVLQANDGVAGGTCGDLVGGDYVFVDSAVGQNPCGGPASAPPACSGTIPAGTYLQSYGTWPTGSSGISNTPLESIPTASGNWILHFYDWYTAVDNGSITGWELCFDTVSGPVSYCTAGTTTNGCLATVSANANPSVSFANACNISVANVEGQKNGILFYGLASNGIPWALGSNSFLCVKPPTQRTGTQSSGGTADLCDGTLSLDWNAYQIANSGALGQTWATGNKAYIQAWFRDPSAVKTTNLSNGLELTYVP